MVLDSHPEKNQKNDGFAENTGREGKGRSIQHWNKLLPTQGAHRIDSSIDCWVQTSSSSSGYGVRGYSHDLRQTPFFHLDLLQLDLIHLLLPLPQSIVEGGINQPSKYGWFIITFNYITLFCSTLLY